MGTRNQRVLFLSLGPGGPCGRTWHVGPEEGAEVSQLAGWVISGPSEAQPSPPGAGMIMASM